MKTDTHLHDWLLMAAIVAVVVLLLSTAQCRAEVVVVTGPGCFPCQRMKAYLPQVEGDVRLVDLAREPDAARELGVTRLPTTIVFRARREIQRYVGYVPRWQLENLVRLSVAKSHGYWRITPTLLGNWRWQWVSTDGT